jgi:hypothetical protein
MLRQIGNTLLRAHDIGLVLEDEKKREKHTERFSVSSEIA